MVFKDIEIKIILLIWQGKYTFNELYTALAIHPQNLTHTLNELIQFNCITKSNRSVYSVTVTPEQLLATELFKFKHLWGNKPIQTNINIESNVLKNAISKRFGNVVEWVVGLFYQYQKISFSTNEIISYINSKKNLFLSMSPTTTIIKPVSQGGVYQILCQLEKQEVLARQNRYYFVRFAKNLLVEPVWFLQNPEFILTQYKLYKNKLTQLQTSLDSSALSAQ